MDGVRRIGRIIGEEAFLPAEALYDEVDTIAGAVGNYGHLSPYIGNRRKRQDSGVARTPAKKLKLIAKVAQTKTMPRNPVNALVNRSAMKVTGKVKVSNRKKVKVGKYLRSAIKQVMSGTTGRGTYTTVKQGYVGSCNAYGGGGLSANVLGVASGAVGSQTVAAFVDPSICPIGFRTLWNALCRNNLASAPSLITQGDLNYFTPYKILDAASVLFNEKAPGDPRITTGNLSEVVAVATGLPLNSTPNLKIDVLDSSVVWRMKNTSDRVVHLDIWECTPTLKFQRDNIVATLLGQLVAFQSGGFDETVEYYKGSTGTISGEYLYEGNYDPLAVSKKYQGLPFKWKKREMVLHPDEACIHTIKGPRGVLDFKNLVQTDAVGGLSQIQLNPLLKGWSVSCCVSVRGDQVFKPQTSGVGGRDVYTRPSGPGVVSFGMPVSIEVEEKYRIAVPEIAGYRTANGAGGTSQTLNFRKDRYKFWNIIENQADTVTGTLGYVVSSEENFVADTTPGRQNQ